MRYTASHVCMTDVRIPISLVPFYFIIELLSIFVVIFVVTCSVEKMFSEILRKSHRKTPVPEAPF